MNDFWKNKPLEKEIRHQIEYHQIKQERIKPGKRLNIQEANDLFFVTNESTNMANAKIFFLMGVKSMISSLFSVRTLNIAQILDFFVFFSLNYTNPPPPFFYIF